MKLVYKITGPSNLYDPLDTQDEQRILNFLVKKYLCIEKQRIKCFDKKKNPIDNLTKNGRILNKHYNLH